MPEDLAPDTRSSELAQALGSASEDCAEQLAAVREIVQWMTDHVVLTDPRGVILYANRAAERITGYRADEMVGQTPALWGHQMDAAYYASFWHTIAQKKEHYRGEVRNKRKDGTLYDAEIHVSPVLDAHGEVRLYVGIERDTSEAKQLQRAKREFISLASHNLKTPLSSVRWYTEMLLDGDAGNVSTSQREYLDEVLNAAKRMAMLIRHWLDISRIDLGLYTFHNEQIDLAEMAQAVLAELAERAAQRDIATHFTPPTTPCIITADREAVHTVVHSLVLNAIKYNRDAGTIEVDVVALPAQHAHASRTFADDRIVFSVQDSGLGIPADEQGRVFQQFFRASNIEHLQTQGAGLALFLTHEIVHMLHGDIWFSSSEEGSRFFVALPASDGTAPSDGEHR